MPVERRPDLPDFRRPPVSEVVLSIQFASLVKFQNYHVGLLWSWMRERYPKVTEHPPLNAAYEKFGVKSPSSEGNIGPIWPWNE